MKILVAEDEPVIAGHYHVLLRARGHDVRITDNGLTCLEVYKSALSEVNKLKSADKVPFDIVMLDYRMPGKNGLDTAREIVKLCPEQRIIFASAYVRETLRDATKELHQIVELIQKPFDYSYLVEVIEDTDVHNQLMKLNFEVKQLKEKGLTHSEIVQLSKSVRDALRVAASSNLTHEELVNLLGSLKKLRGTFLESDS